MIREQQVRRSMRAAYASLKAASFKLDTLLLSNPDLLKGVDIGDIRDEVEIITQRFHEFSAYWNVYNTHNQPATSDVTETETTDTKSKLLDPKKCIAAGGRKRCMDCRCNLPSPPNTVNETWKDYC